MKGVLEGVLEGFSAGSFHNWNGVWGIVYLCYTFTWIKKGHGC